MFFIEQGHAAAHRGVDLLRDRLVAHGEGELLRHRAGERYHCHLPLPRLAQIALARQLLDPAGALTIGKSPAQHEPGVPREQCADHDDADYEPSDHAQPGLLVLHGSHAAVSPSLRIPVRRSDYTVLRSRRNDHGTGSLRSRSMSARMPATIASATTRPLSQRASVASPNIPLAE